MDLVFGSILPSRYREILKSARSRARSRFRKRAASVFMCVPTLRQSVYCDWPHYKMYFAIDFSCWFRWHTEFSVILFFLCFLLSISLLKIITMVWMIQEWTLCTLLHTHTLMRQLLFASWSDHFMPHNLCVFFFCFSLPSSDCNFLHCIFLRFGFRIDLGYIERRRRRNTMTKKRKQKWSVDSFLFLCIGL